MRQCETCDVMEDKKIEDGMRMNVKYIDKIPVEDFVEEERFSSLKTPLSCNSSRQVVFSGNLFLPHSTNALNSSKSISTKSLP